MGENGGNLLREIQKDKQRVRGLEQRDIDASLYHRALTFINGAVPVNIGDLITIQGALENIVRARGAENVPNYYHLAQLAKKKIATLSGGENPIMAQAADLIERRQQSASVINQLRKSRTKNVRK